MTNLSAGKASPVLAAYCEHRAALTRFVSSIVPCSADTDDILQEAVLRAYRAELGRPIEQPKSFLFRIAKHLAFDCLKHAKWKGWEEYNEDAQLAHSPEEQVIAEDSVMHAIEDLTPQQQRVYRLRRFEGLSQKQTADLLGIAVHTMDQHMMRALESVRRVAA